MMHCILLIIYTMIWRSFSEDVPEVTACQDHIRQFSSKNVPKIVDVILGSTVHVECNFCNEKDNYLPKLWYFKKRGSDLNFIEVRLDMETNLTKCKLSMTPSHRLDIKNFQLNDSGIYCCKNNDPNEVEIFLYFLDGVKNNITKKSGKLSQWKEYKWQKLDPINDKFEKSTSEPFLSLRHNFDFTFKLLFSWDSWGPCEPIGKYKGIHKKLGHCQLLPLPNIQYRRMVPVPIAMTSDYDKIKQYFLKDYFAVSCHSLTFNKTLPEIGRIVSILPNYEMVESCDTINNYIPAGNLIKTKKSVFKYKTTKRIGENSHLTLTCPEVALESNVEWYKDDQLLNSSFRNNMADSEQEPRVTIDAYNCLYILHATKNEEAVYTCTVDGEKMQRFDVKVVSKSKLLNQEFIRYSIYLGFVLSLSLTCYCAGMCVAWHRRSSFADPLNIKRQSNKKTKIGEKQYLLR